MRIGRIGAMLATAFLAAARAGAAAEPPTYHGEVSRILQKHCQDCHRPGQVAPFGLLTYDQARKRAEDLAAVTAERRMPPWHASTAEGGPFKDARVLDDAEIATLAAWAEAGCPEGDPADAPEPRSFGSDWALGPPDLVLRPSETFTLEAEGDDEFRVFVMPSGLLEDRWVSGVDFRPGNNRVVHHVVAAFDTTGKARELDEADPGPGYTSVGGFGFTPGGGLAGWAPGKSARYLPDGIGRYLPAGADVLIQVHYHRSGKVEADATEIGLYFARGPVEKQLRVGFVAPPINLSLAAMAARREETGRALDVRPRLEIPAGAEDHEVKGTWYVRHHDYHAVGILPHMHWRGKDFLLTATLPDGTRRTLIRIDRWDFNWQDVYEFVEPIALPVGTRLDMVVHFDNSAANPANPDPSAVVRWGEQTGDEMAIGFLQLTRDSERLDGKMPLGVPRPANFDAPGEARRLQDARD